jgi:hypothetical protein
VPFGDDVEIPVLGMQRLAFVFGLLAALFLAAKPSSAQSWPQRSVKFIVTLGPGSGVDIGTRYDKLAANYLAFVQLASIRLWLRVCAAHSIRKKAKARKPLASPDSP